MKNGLLINAGEAQEKNIGDYIQSVAQEQFFDHIDQYVEREELHALKSDEKVNVIMNGWFMRHPDHFPPSEDINPLFVSFHIAPKIAKSMLTPTTVSYLKRYEPIGCRDTGTQELLEKKGIKTYFSGCLTLTLGQKYLSSDKDGSIYFVDPYYEIGGGAGGATVRSLFWLVKNFGKVCKLMPRFKPEFYCTLYKVSPLLNKAVMCASFYETYKKAFSDDILLNAKFILHKVRQSDFNGEDAKMEYARNLVKLYAKASLVVTSRIHCALPCLGVETPVVFISSEILQGGGYVKEFWKIWRNN